ncbi:MAG: motility protein A [Planctomycetes bacterium]|nr:motility protein A [Planctomycetota bacterium]
MDIASIVGLVMAVGLIFWSMLSGSAPISVFYDLPSVLVVIGGASGAVIICFPLKTVLNLPGVVKKVFLNKTESVPALIEQLVSLAETARRDGLLALEGRLGEVKNSFIRLGVQMAVDGTRPEAIEDIMRTEIDATATRHRDGKAMMDQIGRFAPAFGMIGTLMGLIMMLADMSDPSSIGAGMAVALITTLYGAIVSNVFCIPFAEKLSFYNKQELVRLEIIVRGIMAIQSGENPRVVEQKLNTFLPPKLRPKEEAA